MDKESYQPMTIGHVAIKGPKEEVSSPFLLDPAVGREESKFEKWRVFRERKCNFSLDFTTFGLSVHVGPRRKVVLRNKGYAWTLVLWSFDNSKR